MLNISCVAPGYGSTAALSQGIYEQALGEPSICVHGPSGHLSRQDGQERCYSTGKDEVDGACLL